jgi:hypothetical protein
MNEIRFAGQSLTSLRVEVMQKGRMTSNIFMHWLHQFCNVKSSSFLPSPILLFCRNCWKLRGTLLPSKQTTDDMWISQTGTKKLLAIGLDILGSQWKFSILEKSSAVWWENQCTNNWNTEFYVTGIFSYDLHILSLEPSTSNIVPGVALLEKGDTVCRLKKIQQCSASLCINI